MKRTITFDNEQLKEYVDKKLQYETDSAPMVKEMDKLSGKIQKLQLEAKEKIDKINEELKTKNDEMMDMAQAFFEGYKKEAQASLRELELAERSNEWEYLENVTKNAKGEYVATFIDSIEQAIEKVKEEMEKRELEIDDNLKK